MKAHLDELYALAEGSRKALRAAVRLCDPTNPASDPQDTKALIFAIAALCNAITGSAAVIAAHIMYAADSMRHDHNPPRPQHLHDRTYHGKGTSQPRPGVVPAQSPPRTPTRPPPAAPTRPTKAP